MDVSQTTQQVMEESSPDAQAKLAAKEAKQNTKRLQELQEKMEELLKDTMPEFQMKIETKLGDNQIQVKRLIDK